MRVSDLAPKEAKGFAPTRCFSSVRTSYCFAAFLALALLVSTGLAQQTPESAAPSPAARSSATVPQQALPAGTEQATNEMARAVTRMAEMCEMMMKKEKAALPYLGAAAVTLGTLLFTILVLLVVLQVQWIIYWNRLLKASRANGGRAT